MPKSKEQLKEELKQAVIVKQQAKNELRVLEQKLKEKS